MRYYGRLFAPADMTVIDHEADDGSTDALAVARVPVVCPTTDKADWPLEVARQHQRDLLARGYELVVYTDGDEFLVPDPV